MDIGVSFLVGVGRRTREMMSGAMWAPSEQPRQPDLIHVNPGRLRFFWLMVILEEPMR
jgi:hypothetical protein